MVQKLLWLLLVGVVYFGHGCHGRDNPPKEVDRFEALQRQLDSLKNSQNEMSKELSKVRDENLALTRVMFEKMSTLMERLVSVVDNSASENKIAEELAQIRSQQNSLMQKLISTIANDSKQNKTSEELAIVEKVETVKQSKPTNGTIHDPCPSASSTDLYQLKCESCPPIVLCDADAFEGGWIVLQQRRNGDVNFTRNWSEYRNGFGSISQYSEFWLGLELIHLITHSADYELAIMLKDENGKFGYARYSDFKIAGEEEQYRLSLLGEHSGTLPDSLRYHEDKKYSTFDRDNDDSKDENCSLQYHSGGGWWYGKCAKSSLNGPYIKNSYDNGIMWDRFTEEASASRILIRKK